MNKKTIIIISHVGFDDSPYCSFVHSHSVALTQLGYEVIVLAALYWFPGISIFKQNRKQHYKKMTGTQTIDGVKVIYKKIISTSNLFSKTFFNFNGLSYYFSYKKDIMNLLKNHDVCLIDAHTYEVEGFVATKIKKISQIDTFITLHGTSFRKAFSYNFGKKTIIQRARIIDNYICVSDKLNKQLNSLGVTNSKVIYNGINEYHYSNNIQKNNYSIITVANLIKQKNINLIIQSIHELYQEFPKITLHIVGSGFEKEALCEQAGNLLNKNIFFTGQLSNFDTQKLMRDSKIFILPSINEGFGIVYIEAMKNKCVTIGTANEGIDGVIKDGVNGFLINPIQNDVTKIIKLSLQNKLSELVNNGYITSKDFTWGNNAINYIKLLKGE